MRIEILFSGKHSTTPLREQTVSCKKTSQRPGAETAGALFIALADKPACHSSTTNKD